METHPDPEFYHTKIAAAKYKIKKIKQHFQRSTTQKGNESYVWKTMLSQSPDFDFFLGSPNYESTSQSRDVSQRRSQNLEMESFVRTQVLNLMESIGFTNGIPFTRAFKQLEEFIETEINSMLIIDVPRLRSCSTQHRAEEERVEQSWRKFMYLRGDVIRSMEQTEMYGQEVLYEVYIWWLLRVLNSRSSGDLQDKFIAVCDELFPISFDPLTIPRLPNLLEFQSPDMEKSDSSQLSKTIRKFKNDFNKGVLEIFSNLNHVLVTDCVNKVKDFRDNVNDMMDDFLSYSRQLAELRETVEILKHRVLNAQRKCVFISEKFNHRYDQNVASCALMEYYQTAVRDAHRSIREMAITEVDRLTELFGYLKI